MAVRITEADFRKAHRVPGTEPPPAPKKATSGRRGPNGLEQKFADRVLEMQRQAGDILDYQFEPFTLPVLSAESDGPHRTVTKYTPDWVAWNRDGTTTFYETKGFERAKDFIRFKAAVVRYPHWTFKLVKWDEVNHCFTQETFSAVRDAYRKANGLPPRLEGGKG